MNYWTQDPNESLKYRQTITGDTVSSATWSISPVGPTVGAPTNASTTSTVLVSGVSDNVLYTLTAKITGASGQIKEGAAKIQGQQSHE